jgi:hypothetical protein
LKLEPPLTTPSLNATAQNVSLLHRLLPVWREMLGAEDASPDDNFFEAGGTSLLAARIASRLSVALECRVSAADILAHPSARKLAQKLSGNETSLDRNASDERAAMQRNAFAFQRPVRAPRSST